MLGMPREQAAAEQRVVPIGNNAGVWMRGQVFFKPGFFRGALAATAESPHAAVRVEHDNVPRPQFVAVITLSRLTCLFAPIPEIPISRGAILVISRGWPRTRFKPPPGRAIAVQELF